MPDHVPNYLQDNLASNLLKNPAGSLPKRPADSPAGSPAVCSDDSSPDCPEYCPENGSADCLPRSSVERGDGGAVEEVAMCHPEPFTRCHPERSEGSSATAQDRRREASPQSAQGRLREGSASRAESARERFFAALRMTRGVSQQPHVSYAPGTGDAASDKTPLCAIMYA